MARSRIASTKEVQEVIAAKSEALVEGLFAKGARNRVEEMVALHAYGYHLWNLLRELRQAHGAKKRETKKQALAALTAWFLDTGGSSTTPRLTVADLRDLDVFLAGLADLVAGKQITSEAFAAVRWHRWLKIPKQPKARRFKPEYEEAFRAQRRAEAQGQRRSAGSLAREFIPESYTRNADSALRSMQHALRRIEKEHQRCLQRDIPSPFVPEGERQNER